MRIAISLLLLLIAFSARADWPQFRGPTGQGLAENTNLPLNWNDKEAIAWRTEIPGKAFSSPVMLGENIWLTTAVEAEPTPEQIAEQFEKSGLDETKFLRRQVAGTVSLRVMCVQHTTGKIVRDVEVFRSDSPDAIHIGNSYASPTSVIESGRLYCHFDAGTACLDTQSGKILWTRNIPVFYSVGAGSSPILYEDLLILVCDGIDQQFVVALDKRTGETVWKTDRPTFRTDDGQRRKAYSTPLVVQHAGRDQLIVPAAQWIVSYDPATGEEIWRVDHGEGFSVVPRPVFGHGIVYFCTGYGSDQLWAVRVDGRGDVTKTHVAWKQRGNIPHKPSPLLVDDLLFIVNDTGIATCFDALSGAPHWRKRLGGNYSASPLYAGGRVHFFSHEGDTTVVAASRDYEELAKNHLDGAIMATPAVAETSLILRAGSTLYCIGNP